MKPSRAWPWLWGIVIALALAAPWWLALLGLLALGGLYALVCAAAPEYLCPKCAGHSRHPGVIGSVFGGFRRGCHSRRCHGGTRIRTGLYVINGGRARWLAAHPGKEEPGRRAA